MLRKLRDLNIGLRFCVVFIPLLGLLLGALAFALSSTMAGSLEARGLSDLRRQNELILGLLGSYHQTVVQSTTRLGEVFASALPGPYSLNLGGSEPSLLGAGRVLNGDNAAVDRFAALTGGVATVFVRRGDEFVRIATSVHDGSGKRVLGTALDPASPAYARALKGEPYVGKVTLFGRDYVAQYRPLKSARQEVVGVAFVGQDFTEVLKQLRERLGQIKVGDSGYVWVVDASPGKNRGLLLVHPKRVGTSLLDDRDVNGRAYVQDMLAMGSGVLRYDYLTKGSKEAVGKVAAFGLFPEWNWLVVSAAINAEFSQEAVGVRNYTMAATAGILLLCGALLVWLARRWVGRPLAEVVGLARRLARGDLSAEVQVDSRDEAGQLKECMMQLRGSIADLAGKLGGLVERANAGDFKARVDTTGMEGFQQEIGSGLNALMATTDAGLSEVVRVLGAIAGGELDQRMEGAYRGSFAELTSYTNATVDVLGRLVGQLGHLVEQANQGNFRVSAAREGLQGFQLEIADGLNALMITTGRGLEDVVRVLGAVSEGRLDERINDPYEGAFLQLKDYCNHTVGVLGQLVSELRRVVTEANAGNFGARVDAQGMQGFQQEIAAGLNALMSTTEAGLRDVGRVLGAVSGGRLDERVEAPYRGAFDRLKQDANNTVDVLARLVAELNRVVGQANAGNFRIEVDSQGLAGFQRDIAQGLDALMRSTDRGLSDAVRVLGALASGALERSDDTRSEGAFEELRTYCNRTVDVLGGLIGQMRVAVAEANRGNFAVRIDTAGLSGFQADLGAGLNGLMQTTDAGLREIARMLAAIARGDLTERITTPFEGTFGQLRDDANQTVEQLVQTVKQIQDSAHSVAEAAVQIAKGNSDLARRTEHQASALEEVASSVEELSAAVRQSAENARSTGELADAATQRAREGGAVVARVVNTMSRIDESSRRIHDIIGVIDGIAFQTNILALNAAVEAARAGEQGRGFAVVAQEVRNLAKRSATAAGEVRSLIQDSNERVSTGSDLVRSAGQSMGEIVGGVEGVSQLMAQLTHSSREQTEGIEQVRVAVTEIDRNTQQNAALVDEAAAAAASLQEQAERMLTAAGVFRLADR